MSNKRIFSRKIVYIVSLILTIFSALIYLMGFIVRINENKTSFLGLVFIFLILILALLQTYYLLIKNRKGILLTNIHLIIILCFLVYEFVNELINYKIYTRNANGIVFIIVFISVSLFIVNKFKTPKIEYQDLEEIGKHKE